MSTVTVAGPLRRAALWWGNFVFRHRNRLFPLIILGLLFGLRPATTVAGVAIDPWLDVVGLLMAVAGQALRAAVIGLAYIKRGGVNKRIAAERLVTEGLFAHSRNPLYVGNLLILWGLFLIHGNPWVVAIGVAFSALTYRAIVLAEETFLAGRFGDEYRAYCARVNRWWPSPAGLGRTLRGMRFDWQRVAAKDGPSAWLWMLLACALFGWEGFVRAGDAQAARAALEAAGAVALAITVLLGLLILAARRARRLGRASASG